MKTVLIADDHAIVRHVIRVIIEERSSEYNILEAATLKEVVKILSEQEVDFGIFDMLLADGNMFSTILSAVERYPGTRILVCSTSAEKIYAMRLIRKGVKGFVCKQKSINELEKAIQVFLNGEIYVSSSLKEQLDQPKTAQTTNPIDLLSDRELEVVEYAVAGMGTKEIAEKMNLENMTISTFLKRAYNKLEVVNLVELVEKFQLYSQ